MIFCPTSCQCLKCKENTKVEVFDLVNVRTHFMYKSGMKDWHLMTRACVVSFEIETLHILPGINFWIQIAQCVFFMTISLEAHLLRQNNIIYLLISNYISLVKIFLFSKSNRNIPSSEMFLMLFLGSESCSEWGDPSVGKNEG